MAPAPEQAEHCLVLEFISIQRKRRERGWKDGLQESSFDGWSSYIPVLPIILADQRYQHISFAQISLSHICEGVSHAGLIHGLLAQLSYRRPGFNYNKEHITGLTHGDRKPQRSALFNASSSQLKKQGPPRPES
jgi:hypothetical protein